MNSLRYCAVCTAVPLSTIAAHKLYPVRVRLVNAVADKDDWYTIAYIPQVVTQKGTGGAERSRLRRIAILQRVLYLAFRSVIAASHSGVDVRGKAHRQLLAFPRILLYICDQPEERSVLCFKPGLCHRPCSLCDVKLADMATAQAVRAKERCALGITDKQLEAHGHRVNSRESQRRNDLERDHSINSQPPALAAMAGLCTPPFLLYKIIGIDVLHVRH